METIKQILIRRDNLSPKEADNLIEEAKETLFSCIDEGDTERAENICEEFFGLEPDFLFELI